LSKLTVVTWLWKPENAKRSYSAKHVNALHRQLNEHLNIPHKLVCVTDDPKGINCATYPIWDEPKAKMTEKSRTNCYRRLKLFSREAKDMFGEWVLSIDLDTLIRHDISKLITFEDDFKIMKGAVTPMNGSMWILRTGSHPEIWEQFNPEKSPQEAMKNKMPDGRPFFGSDQSWISHCFLGENVPTWDKSDGIYHFVNDLGPRPVPPSTKMIFFPGDIKPWFGEMLNKNKEIFTEYRKYLDGV